MSELKSLEYLRNIERKIVTSLQFKGIVLVNIKEIVANIDRMYATLPVDVQEIRISNKSFELNPNTYNDLEKLELLLENSIYIFGFYRIIKISELSLIIRNIYEDLGAIN